MASVIKITATRLRSTEGQAGICAAMDMEATLGNQYGFEGTPSLRSLLIDKMAEWPYSDNLFRIYAEVTQHQYQDAQRASEWLKSRAKRLTQPKAVASYVNARSYAAYEGVRGLSYTILEEAFPLIETYDRLNLLRNMLENCPRVVRPKYMTTVLRSQIGEYDMAQLVKGYCQVWRSEPRLIRAMVNLTNAYIRERMESKPEQILMHLRCAIHEQLTPLEFKYTLHNPATMDVDAFVDKVLKEDQHD
jgi:hypothetical protein